MSRVFNYFSSYLFDSDKKNIVRKYGWKRGEKYEKHEKKNMLKKMLVTLQK